MAQAAPRRRKIIGHRRRVDEAEDDGGPEHLDLDDDSLTDGSMGSDENDAADDSDTSNVDETSPTSPSAKKLGQNGAAKHGIRRQVDVGSGNGSAAKQIQPIVTDTEIMLNRLSLAAKDETAQEINFEDHQQQEPPAKGNAPIVVSSNSAIKEQQEAAARQPPQEVKRREHDEYRRKRDEDPTFIPNRGAFFMHDHRHPGPAANGFRPFPKGARGRGRGVFGGGPFPHPVSQFSGPSDPTTNAPWTHDMHEEVAAPPQHHHRQARYTAEQEGPANGNGHIPTAPPSHSKINREMSCEKHISNVTVRVYMPPTIPAAKLFSTVPVKQYTKLPDHRPPLRRDKPVRISLPYHQSPLMPRYIFPANDRSFIFIPRAMRPNQKPLRGKGPRSIIGSVGGFSRRTSVWGGSHYGSIYSPSIAQSRRSSIAPEFGGRELLLSPTGSAISRPPLPVDNFRPVVRLPPLAQPQGGAGPMSGPPDAFDRAPLSAGGSSINDFPQPQTHPLPQKPTFQENRQTNIPMHQPRPQKTVSVENIESPAQAMNAPPPYHQQAFHHQVPPQIQSHFAQDIHGRHPSYPSQLSSQTPLSQIPERAIHAAPFQPNTFAQPGYYNQQYPVMQPQQQGFYYPQTFAPNVAPNASAPSFVPGPQPGQPMAYNPQPTQGETPAGQPPAAAQGLVAQEMNGTVYYYEASQIAPMANFPSFPPAQQFAPGVGMGVVTPSPDAPFYYQQQPAQGMMYYSQ